MLPLDYDVRQTLVKDISSYQDTISLISATFLIVWSSLSFLFGYTGNLDKQIIFFV